jgi:hypothetical protein
VRLRGTIVQDFLPPDRIEARIVKGFLKGTEYTGIFREDGGETTVEETYHLSVPDWRWFRPLLTARLVRALDRIWAEDLRVGVCHGGWPGLPESSQRPAMSAP